MLAPDAKGEGGGILTQNAVTFDPKKISTEYNLSVLEVPGRDGLYRLRVLEMRNLDTGKGKVALGSRTGFREIETKEAGEVLIQMIASGALQVKFGAQQGQAWSVEIIEPGQATSTSNVGHVVRVNAQE